MDIAYVPIMSNPAVYLCYNCNYFNRNSKNKLGRKITGTFQFGFQNKSATKSDLTSDKSRVASDLKNQPSFSMHREQTTLWGSVQEQVPKGSELGPATSSWITTARSSWGSTWTPPAAEPQPNADTQQADRVQRGQEPDTWTVISLLSSRFTCLLSKCKNTRLGSIFLKVPILRAWRQHREVSQHGKSRTNLAEGQLLMRHLKPNHFTCSHQGMLHESSAFASSTPH